MLKNLPPVFFRIRSALMGRGRSEHEADDLVQEAWIRLNCYEREQEVREPEAFLMRTALNLSIDGYRTRQAQGPEVVLDEGAVVDTAPGTEQVVLNRERLERLSQGLARMNEKTRDIFMANRIEGLGYREIGKRHGLSPSTVEKHVARATLHLTNWMRGW